MIIMLLITVCIVGMSLGCIPAHIPDITDHRLLVPCSGGIAGSLGYCMFGVYMLFGFVRVVDPIGIVCILLYHLY